MKLNEELPNRDKKMDRQELIDFVGIDMEEDYLVAGYPLSEFIDLLYNEYENYFNQNMHDHYIEAVHAIYKHELIYKKK